jgi:hypothetical protein
VPADIQANPTQPRPEVLGSSEAIKAEKGVQGGLLCRIVRQIIIP